MAKIQNIQALRGIAVLLVVLYHLLTIEEKYGGARTLLPDILEFGMFGVDLFFVISGFVMVTITRGRFRNTRQALRFLYHRVSRIYPTYWFYTVLVLIVFLVQPTLVNTSQGNEVDIVASLLLFPTHLLPLVMVGWTLIHEIYFYLVFFVILLLVPERFFLYAVSAWGVAVAVAHVSLGPVSPLVGVLTHPLTFEFIGGCLVALVYYRAWLRAGNTLLSILALCSLAAAVGGYLMLPEEVGLVEQSGGWRVLIFGVPGVLLVYCATYVERNGYVLPALLRNIGDASYSIYLSHILTLSSCGRLWNLFSSDSRVDNLVLLPLFLVLVLAVGFASYRFVEQPLLRITRRITPAYICQSRPR